MRGAGAIIGAKRDDCPRRVDVLDMMWVLLVAAGKDQVGKKP